MLKAIATVLVLATCGWFVGCSSPHTPRQPMGEEIWRVVPKGAIR